MQFFHNYSKDGLLVHETLIVKDGISTISPEMDTKIESTIKNSYIFKNFIPNNEITVKCSNGMVQLSGTIEKDYHRVLAVKATAETAHVKSIRDELQVKIVLREGHFKKVFSKLEQALKRFGSVRALATYVFFGPEFYGILT